MDPKPPKSRQLTVRQDARSDLAQAYDWYESQEPGVGERFLDAYEATLSLIEKRPLSFPRASGKVRKALIPKFPYLILYEVEEDAIDVIAVYHGMRNPGGWRDRI